MRLLVQEPNVAKRGLFKTGIQH